MAYFVHLGNYLNATQEALDFQEFDIQVSMKGPEKFKPGLPYNAEVS